MKCAITTSPQLLSFKSYFRSLCGMFGNTLKRLILKLLIIWLPAIVCLSIQLSIPSSVFRNPQMNSMKHNNNKKGRKHNPAWSFSPELSDSCDITRRLMYSGLYFNTHFKVFFLVRWDRGRGQEVMWNGIILKFP